MKFLILILIYLVFIVLGLWIMYYPRTCSGVTPIDFITEQEFLADYPDKHYYTFFANRTTILTRSELWYAVRSARKFEVNPLVVLATIQKESSLLDGGKCMNKFRPKAMGYEHPGVRGYRTQVWHGSRCLRRHFDSGKKMALVLDLQKKLTVNRAVYALYRYTPRWKANRMFYYIFKVYQKEMREYCNSDFIVPATAKNIIIGQAVFFLIDLYHKRKKLIKEKKMLVKVKDKIYDGEKEPVMVILTKEEKREIKNMSSDATNYCSFPDTDEWTENNYKKIKKWMDANYKFKLYR